MLAITLFLIFICFTKMIRDKWLLSNVEILIVYILSKNISKKYHQFNIDKVFNKGQYYRIFTHVFVSNDILDFYITIIYMVLIDITLEKFTILYVSNVMLILLMNFVLMNFAYMKSLIVVNTFGFQVIMNSLFIYNDEISTLLFLQMTKIITYTFLNIPSKYYSKMFNINMTIIQLISSMISSKILSYLMINQ